MNNFSQIFVVGDIHGCHIFLTQIHKKILDISNKSKQLKDLISFLEDASYEDILYKYLGRKSIKDLAKHINLEEKRLIKEEKDLAKQINLEEKKRIKGEKKSYKRKIYVNKEKQLKKAEIDLDEFSELVEKITKKNTFKPYPDINEIPN